MYAITGITGKVGGVLARVLLPDGRPDRVVLRAADKGDDLAEGHCEVALAKTKYAVALTSGFKGAQGRFILLNTWCILAASLLVVGPAGAGAQGSRADDQSLEYKAMSMKDDLAHRSPDIRWPTGFEPEKADLFAHNDLLINASCERVWTHIVQASRWPTWYPNSKDVQIQDGDPVLQDGTVFRWTTFGLAMESQVHEYVLNQRLGWYGYAPGAKPSFYHSWYLEPKGTMCHVVMDEAGVGKEAAGLRKSDETLMHRGHDLWLATLKWVAEAK